MLPAAALPAAACLWLILLLAAPLAIERGSFPVAATGLYRSASLLCHQKTQRSFTVAQVQMPVCARCFGLYAAGALGALAGWFLGRNRGTPSALAGRVTLGLAAIPLLLSVGLEWIGVLQGSNFSRFLSALPLGLAAGWLIERVIMGEDSMLAASFG